MALRNVKEYHRPKAVEEALEVLNSGLSGVAAEGRIVPLAGGTELVGTGGPEIVGVVDLAALDLAYVRSEVGQVRIGAMTPLQTLVEAAEVADPPLDIMAPAARLEAGYNVRLAATLGGTLVVAGAEDPLAVVLLALDAELQWAVGSEQWAVLLDDFVSERERYLGQGGLITEVMIPRGEIGAAAAFVRVGRTPADGPIVCAAANVTLMEGKCASVRLALGGVADRPVLLHQVEKMVAGQRVSDELLTAVAEAVRSAVSPPSDYRGSADYRGAIAGVLARRALAQSAASADRRTVEMPPHVGA